MGVGGRVHGDVGGDAAALHGGCCAAQSHGDGGAVPKGGNGLSGGGIAYLGPHGLKHGAHRQEGAAVPRLRCGVREGQIPAVQLDGDGGGWGGGRDGLRGQGGGAGTQQGCRTGDSQGALGKCVHDSIPPFIGRATIARFFCGDKRAGALLMRKNQIFYFA